MLVAALALAAAGATVGVTLLTRTGTGGGSTQAAPVKQSGRPPFLVDLGVRTDAEASALARAGDLYTHGHVKAARAVFVRYRSLEAQIGLALTDWPAGFGRIEQLARSHPGSALAQYTVGVARFWEGRFAGADAAWTRAKAIRPDSAYAVRADTFLHPGDAPGLPQFAPSFPAPAALSRLTPIQQYRYLRAQARKGGTRARLLYGVELQNLNRPVSAEREFAAAAALAPHDPDAQVAAAVGLFDKARPSVAFARLGPLVRVFPKAITVRYHLGLMLVWIGRVDAAKVQLRKVVDAGPSPFLSTAQLLLARLAHK